jgi:pimeloyl-ACP methyl ester carboxylesterase
VSLTAGIGVGDHALRGLGLPARITQGRFDTMVLPALAEPIPSRCAQARLSQYANCAHRPFLEATVRCEHELAEFMRAT